jgi:hypothetical protein
LRDHAIRLVNRAGVIACADVAMAKAKPATAINRGISFKLSIPDVVALLFVIL